MKIAVLTSGGDAPGMNACIRSIVRSGIYNDVDVYGVMRGFEGLMDGDFKLMSVRDVGNIIQKGGTILKTSRSIEFLTQKGQMRAVDSLKKAGIEYLVVIGGDGSYRGAHDLAQYGIKVICVPGSIDNDVASSEQAIGFDTAVNTVVNLVNNLRDTSDSHDRISVVEVMGRNCGDIALFSGLASGADIVIVPEIKIGLNEVCKKLMVSIKSGKKASIVIIAEGAGKSEDVVKAIKQTLSVDARAVVIGHIQRGGTATMFDRILATEMGSFVIQLVLKKKSGVAVCSIKNEITSVPLSTAIKAKREFKTELYKLVDVLSI